MPQRPRRAVAWVGERRLAVFDERGIERLEIGEAEGIKLDEPPRKSPTGSTITYITDPWGTRIEIIQRGALGAQVQ